MRFKLKAALLLVLTILFLSDDAFGQRRRRNSFKKRKSKSRNVGKYRGSRTQGGASRFKPYQYVGFGVNALNYFGDLAPVNKAASTDISFTRPGFGLMYGYKFHPSMAARVSFNAGLLTGDDFTSDPNDAESAARYQRNLSFRNFVKELSVGMEFYVLPNYRGASVRPPINAYIFLGIAGFHHQPQGQAPAFDYQTGSDVPLPNGLSDGEWVNLQPLGTEGQNIAGSGKSPYSLFQLAIPIGIGGEVALPGPLSFGIELGYRFLFTDFIDDVSDSYVGLDQFNDPIARIFSDRGVEPVSASRGGTRDVASVVPTDFNGITYNSNGFIGSGVDGSIRGNPNNNDMYFITQIRVTYVLSSTRRRSTAKFR